MFLFNTKRLIHNLRYYHCANNTANSVCILELFRKRLPVVRENAVILYKDKTNKQLALHKAVGYALIFFIDKRIFLYCKGLYQHV